MDKLENYRFLIKKILTEYHQLFSSASPDNIEMLLAFDEQRDQYLWFQVGWTTEERIKGISVHIRIKFALKMIRYILRKIGPRKVLQRSY